MKKLITQSEFAKMLMAITLSSFADVQSETEPKLLKKDRETKMPIPFKQVLNHRILNIQLNYNYDKQVNDKAEKEGLRREFEAKEHTWAKRIAGALAGKKDYDFDVNNIDTSKCYMAYKIQTIRAQSFIADGKEIAKDLLTNFLPPKRNYDNQPAEQKTAIQYMKLSSVKEFVFAGDQYRII